MTSQDSLPPARLFYDPGCGPCSFFARVSVWACRSGLRAIPYDGEEAARELADLAEATRFAYAHLVDAHGRKSGAAIMAPLVALSLGSTGERVVTRTKPLDRGLCWLYERFWNYRRTRGCAAPSTVPVA